MSRLALRVVAVAGVIALLGVGSYAIAGSGTNNFKRRPAATGTKRIRTFRPLPRGSFDAKLSDDGNSLHYMLSYSGLGGNVLQSHVHFGEDRDQRRYLVLPLQDDRGTIAVRQHADVSGSPTDGRGRYHFGRRDRAGHRGPADGGPGDRAGQPRRDPRGDARRPRLRERALTSGPAARSAPRSTTTATATTVSRQRRLGGEAGLEARDHVKCERRRPRPVDDAMVERDRDVADLADDDLPVANDGARADPV